MVDETDPGGPPRAPGARWRRPSLAVWAVVLANLVPALGLLAFGWDPWVVLAGYWAESGVVGLWYLVRIATCRRSPWAALFAAPFFTLHFGGFMAVHGLFLLAFWAIGDGDLAAWAAREDATIDLAPRLAHLTRPEHLEHIAWMLGSLFVSHGVATARDHFASGRFRDLMPLDPMTEPYGRIVVMHLALVLGAALAIPLGGFSAGLLLVFVVAKIALDAHALHRLEGPRGRP